MTVLISRLPAQESMARCLFQGTTTGHKAVRGEGQGASLYRGGFRKQGTSNSRIPTVRAPEKGVPEFSEASTSRCHLWSP